MNLLSKIYNLISNKKTITKDKRRSFTQTQKKHMWVIQDWKCNICHCLLDLRSVVYDHIIRHADWGLTELANGQALCPHCHNIKTFEENLNKLK